MQELHRTQNKKLAGVLTTFISVTASLVTTANYLEESLFCFTMVLIEDENKDKGEADAKELEVSDSEEEKKKTKIYKRSKRTLKLLSVLPPLICPPVVCVSFFLYLPCLSLGLPLCLRLLCLCPGLLLRFCLLC